MTATATRGAAGTKDDAPVLSAKDAKKQKKKDAAAKGPKKSLLKSKKFMMIMVGVLAVGGGAYKFLAPVPKPPPPTGGVIVPLDPNTLNLTDGHYLKVALGIQLIAGKGTVETFLPSKAAELVINEFSDRTVRELSTNKARKAMVVDLGTAIKKAYPDEVFAIFLTQFVTQ